MVVAAALLIITLASAQDHERYHLSLEIIPRQRELAQQITFFALSNPANSQLADKVKQFEVNMAALRASFPENGYLIDHVLISHTGVKFIGDELYRVFSSWRAYRDTLETMKTIPDSEPAWSLIGEELQEESELLLAQLDVTSVAINDHMEIVLTLVRRWQAFLVVAGAVLAMWGILNRAGHAPGNGGECAERRC